MTPERVERYVIEQHPHGVVVRMRQGWRALAVALLSLAVVAASWWFGPYGPQPASAWARADLFYWLWSGFFTLAFILSLLGALYREDWTIAEHEIASAKSVGPWRSARRVATGRTLAIRVDHLTDADEGRIFPYRLRFLDSDGNDSGLRVELQSARSVDRFLDALRPALTLDVEDPSGR